MSIGSSEVLENSCVGSFEMELECSWLDRQGQGFDCRIYSVSNQNKRFNFASSSFQKLENNKSRNPKI